MMSAVRGAAAVLLSPTTPSQQKGQAIPYPCVVEPPRPQTRQKRTRRQDH